MSWESKSVKVLVTGATGFLGSRVIESLLTKDVDIIATSKNKDKAESLQLPSQVSYKIFDIDVPSGNAFDQLGQPDLLIHLAWQGLPHYQESFHMEKNYPKHCAFLKSMLESGLKRLVVTGTCLEYGMKTGLLSENMKPEPSVPYAQAKNSLRKYIEELQKNLVFDFKWIRLFYMFGAGQNEASLFTQLSKALARGDSSFNMSAGEQVRDFMPVEEVAEKIVQISLQNDINGIVNCCSGNPISVKDLVENYLKTVNKKIRLNLGYYPYSAYESMAFWGSTDKMQQALNAFSFGRARTL
jgi:nucleoside-diphosphate-sugar epimerase